MMDSSANRNLVQLPKATLTSLLRRLGSGRSAAEAAKILRDLGVGAAEPIHDILRDRLDSGDPADVATDAFWSELNVLFQDFGWGMLDQEMLHPGIIALTSLNWFETVGASATHPSCHFSTGMLAELFRSVAGTDLAAMEVECRSTGAPQCRFLIGSPVALEGIFANMTRGDTYQGAIATLA